MNRRTSMITSADIPTGQTRRHDQATCAVRSRRETTLALPGLIWSALAMLGIGVEGILWPSEVPDEHSQRLGIG